MDVIYLLRRIAYKFYEVLHPDEPWIAQGAIQYCDRHLQRDQVGFEWGSGRSTAWFGKRLRTLVSIEFDQEWHNKVTEKLRRQNLTNVECRYIPVEHPLSEPTPAHYPKTPAYVIAINQFDDNSVDFAMVDGHYRQACILAALPKLKPGGLLLVDNTDWITLSEWGVPADWQIVHQSRNVMTQTTIWQKPVAQQLEQTFGSSGLFV
ncbi:class I SAM-dependent methyltransferase [Leptolyngbya sp. FACHB-17]|uniref:class I SAM-dependent methyltransferase n=1 Tax=unclassified Leptolyngbya TaxID=2650499 RepID=UPI00168073B0|nr:class I SAM-dependent methyltransferase [Leptolyngbya sp. FACHB-17]MBD2081725.1 class I SAM-dependent methyltransferase [Leptolyngbya sp. FACHB-17]